MSDDSGVNGSVKVGGPVNAGFNSDGSFVAGARSTLWRASQSLYCPAWRVARLMAQ
jgi:hypothetical protein